MAWYTSSKVAAPSYRRSRASTGPVATASTTAALGWRAVRRRHRAAPRSASVAPGGTRSGPAGPSPTTITRGRLSPSGDAEGPTAVSAGGATRHGAQGRSRRRGCSGIGIEQERRLGRGGDRDAPSGAPGPVLGVELDVGPAHQVGEGGGEARPSPGEEPLADPRLGAA